MQDILGRAMLDYFTLLKPSKLWVHNSYGDKEEMPVGMYFRSFNDMPQMELTALQHCRGKVLDIGAGAGSHALALQDSGVYVTALEISPGAAEVMRRRGVDRIVNNDIFNFHETGFDTLLLLMNGIGLAQTLDGLPAFLQHVKNMLNPGGIILFDSSDIAYLYEDGVPAQENYYGEMLYRYEYKKQKGHWFKWLYVDKHTMARIAFEDGWLFTVLEEDEHDQYLGMLTR